MKVVVILSLFCLAVRAQKTTICDLETCTCTASNVTCNCKSKDLIIDGTSHFIPDNMVNLTVQNCNLFRLGSNLNNKIKAINVKDVTEFKMINLKELDVSNLTVSNVKLLALMNATDLSVANLIVSQVDRFHVQNQTKLRVISLTVSDVKEVDLADAVRSNRGEAQHFRFRRSVLPSIGEKAFDFLNLQHLEFDECTIGSLSADAVSLNAFTSSPDTRFIVQRCTIGSVASGALEISAKFVNILNNKLNGNLAQSSLYFEKGFNLNFNGNNVPGLLINETLTITEYENVQFFNNTFARIHRRTFLNVNADHLQIRNNTVREAWEIPFMTSNDCSDCDISGNRLPCGCLTLDEMENELKKLTNQRQKLARRILQNPCTHNSLVNPLSLIEGNKDRRLKECETSHSSSRVVSNLVFLFVAANFLLFI